ncbi:Hypothetical predicted protein [Octopus vulgaris]|uniref:Uncharacterized protein n=1 Tax=Octopus vulgaris TaxID=6645 RepID=A0AA36B5A6_OCTVU|nr:Hypothetical predicted protein [Octopus vulgaris]
MIIITISSVNSLHWKSKLLQHSRRHNEKIWNEFVNPFDQLRVKIIFCTLYSIIFASCFFGNLLVLYIIIRNARLRTRTNFFLSKPCCCGFLCRCILCLSKFINVYFANLAFWKSDVQNLLLRPLYESHRTRFTVDRYFNGTLRGHLASSESQAAVHL